MIGTRTAVSAAFILNGWVYGSWVGRVPALAHQVGADEGALGFALLGQVAGLLAGASFAGWACAALGTRRVTFTALPTMCLALVVLSVPHSYALLGAAFFLIGFTVGTLDVAMNICAVQVTAEAGRPLMPFFHGVFSAGAVAGSGGAALAAWADWTTRPHFVLVALVAAILVAVFARGLPKVGAEQTKKRETAPPATDNAPQPLRQMMLWLIALTLFCAAIGEGAMANWSVLFLDEERGLSASAAAAGYTVFSITTVIVRLLGVRLEEKLGPYLLLSLCGGTAAGGLLIAVTLPWAVAGYAGLALAGLGFALVFPVAIGQAGLYGKTLGTSGEREVGFVSSVAYVGLVSGPPAIGALAHATSLSLALGLVGAVVALVVVFSRLAARHHRQSVANSPETTESGLPQGALNAVRWAVLSTGWAAAAFTEDVLPLPDAELLAVGSRRSDSARSFADRYGIPRAYGSRQELLADPEVHIVYVASVNAAHYGAVRACLESGKHVLCEKPLATNAQDAADLAELAAARGLLLMEAMWTRCLPAVRRAAELVASGAIGTPHLLRAATGGPAPARGAPPA